MRGAKKSLSARKARGGDIVLRTRSERFIFIAGLGASVVLAVVLIIVAIHLPG